MLPVSSPGDVFIIAEIGINHEGDAETCGRMIDAAKEAGADAVKLQTIDPDKNYVKGTESHRIFSESSLSPEQTSRIFHYARASKISCFTTVGDLETLDWVNRLGPVAHKISSGLLTHTALIRSAADTGRPIIMSTGMADEAEIDTALAAIGRRVPTTLMQCTSIYPAPPDSLNLRAIRWMERRFEVDCGFSDHSLGTEAAALAVAAGASSIEKHFSLDPTRSGFDHPISLNPQDFRLMVEKIRQTQLMLGVEGKMVPAPLHDARAIYLRCLVAKQPITIGTLLTHDNVAVKRPLPNRRGMPADKLDSVLGCRALVDIAIDEPIQSDSIED